MTLALSKGVWGGVWKRSPDRGSGMCKGSMKEKCMCIRGDEEMGEEKARRGQDLQGTMDSMRPKME